MRGDAKPDGGFLRWMSLPKLDFVEVYGAEADARDAAVRRAAELQAAMQAALEAGSLAEARAAEEELDELCRKEGLSFREVPMADAISDGGPG